MIATVPGVPSLVQTTQQPAAGRPAVTQGVPLPAFGDAARAAARLRVGAPRPLPAAQPNGDPCSLTLWGSDEWEA